MNKKIVSVNLGNFGSTGGIMRSISGVVNNEGGKAIQVYPGHSHNLKPEKDDIIICSKLRNKINQRLAYYTGFNGCFAIFSTIHFINRSKDVHPDILHFHNLHNSYINLPILFHYIKKYNLRTIWTLHDCWAFTGHCPHFTMVKCEKWKTGCHDCPSYRDYPQSYFDNSKMMWQLKKKWFTGIKNMTIVTPSQWLADLVKQSFLKDYPVITINNGIDLSVFKPTPSPFREKYGIREEQCVLLGVAFDWGIRKGLDVFVKLAEQLDERYQIVLVGTNEEIDKELPENIISIHRTQNQAELAEIYTASDIFVNPTREENFPTVNMEALACGTPVITFDTGGSPEIIDHTCGSVTPVDDISALAKEIENIFIEKKYSIAACVKRAERFNCNDRFMEYVNLYSKVLADK